jgi:hypothetical protein
VNAFIAARGGRIENLRSEFAERRRA